MELYRCMGITHASGAPMSVMDGVKVVEQAYDMGYILFDTAECYTGINPDGSAAYNAYRRITLTCIISTVLTRTYPRRKWREQWQN